MNREKVIRAVDSCFDYWLEQHRCLQPLEQEAVQQLKADALAMLKAQEIKTGYWIDSAGNDKCSVCGTEYSDLYPDYGKTHFCPNCGAKMERQAKLGE